MRGRARVSQAVGIAAVLALGELFVIAGPAAPRSQAATPQLPEGWRELPELVLEPAAGTQVRVESRRGYGDRANGCYALVQRVSGERVRAESARAALATGLKKRGLEVSGDGAELAIKGLGIEGRIRTAMSGEPGGRFAAVSAACFYNGRQPDRCKPQCDALLDRLGGGR